jgi:hypothetical protein
VLIPFTEYVGTGENSENRLRYRSQVNIPSQSVSSTPRHPTSHSAVGMLRVFESIKWPSVMCFGDADKKALFFDRHHVLTVRGDGGHRTAGEFKVEV